MVVFALLASLLVQQPQQIPAECNDDRGVNRCDPENRAEVLRALGMASIEEEKAAGVEVYRVMQIDGYGRVMPAIAYERRVGAAPQIVIYGEGRNRLSAAVPAEEWSMVQRMAELADRTLEPLSGPVSPLANICLHSWISTAEIANAAPRGVPEGPVQRRVEDACGGELTTRFAFDLAALAIKHFPACQMLDPDDYRNDVMRLEQCSRFKGDHMAAAQLVNQVGWRLAPRENVDRVRAWASLLRPAKGATLDWIGETVIVDERLGADRIARFLAERSAEPSILRAYIGGFNGVSSTRVETTGYLEQDGPDDRTSRAAFTQVWLWDSAGLSWQLARWTVEPFGPPT